MSAGVSSRRREGAGPRAASAEDRLSTLALAVVGATAGVMIRAMLASAARTATVGPYGDAAPKSRRPPLRAAADELAYTILAGAKICAGFVRVAADVYERRDVLRKD